VKVTPSKIIKRSVVISGHATSVSIESEFWKVLQDIAAADGLSVAALIRQIDKNLPPSEHRNLSSAIRVYALKRVQQAK
jgi:predicted DNA-binding ribbon-helix-helix protein